jgi:pyruvate,water dikinase|tara:strand:+ start:4800 stop:7349 length:2550 start_codon:yes stop_codon:yes gene_type:complete
MNYIVWAKDLNKEKVEIAGGKGAQLGELTAGGLPVPECFVVTAQTYKKFVDDADIIEDINEILKDLDVEDNDKLQKASKDIGSMITGSPMPEDMQEEIKQEYLKIKSTDDIIIAGTGQEQGEYVAVRSSATAEDLPGASFAGQQATFLNIKGGTDLITAVKECWASLFTARAIYYRVKKGFDHEKVLISVIVQKMVDSDKSGVMFTVNPVDNDRSKISIDSAWGLGEAIVGGQVTPDHFLIDKNTLEIAEKRISKKKFMYTRNIAAGKTEKMVLTDETANKESVTDEEVKRIAELGKKIEEHYDYPQDIEWAIDGDNLYILQSRPVTTLGDGEEQKSVVSTQQSEKPTTDNRPLTTEPTGDSLVKGFGASPGIGGGKVKIIASSEELDKVQKGNVLVAKMTTPDMVPAMERASAIVTNEGGVTCHAAIVSRELGIPCIVGSENATTVLKDEQEVTVDANQGIVFPGIKAGASTEPKKLETAEKIPTKTKVYVNLGIPSKAEEVAALPVDGVGLMREEFIIASQIGEHPLAMIERGAAQEFIDKLAEGIQEVAEAFNPRPVVLRLSDLKTNEYHDLKGGEKFENPEDNPMIGWRGCSRYTSDKYKEAFKLELKAVKKVRDAGFKNIVIMLPFVRKLEDVTKVTELMKEAGLERGEDLKLWIMAEVPSVVVLADEFAKLVDGFSIGSNDLTQLTMGADRDSELLEKLGYFDERDEAVLRSIARLIKLGNAAGITVSICGQAPSTKPEIIKFLVEKGITSISANPDVAVQTMKMVATEESKITLAKDEAENEQPVAPVPAPVTPAPEPKAQSLTPNAPEQEGILEKVADAVGEVGEKIGGLFHHEKKEEEQQ